MITPTQIKMARAALGLSQAQVAELAGLSTTAFNSIEQGISDPKASTLRNIQAAFEAKGAVFYVDGGVNVVPKSERFIREAANPSSSATRTAALEIVNIGRRLRGQAPLKDEDG
jgi:transcriptional regulator with XRE-family HTH domain